MKELFDLNIKIFFLLKLGIEEGHKYLAELSDMIALEKEKLTDEEYEKIINKASKNLDELWDIIEKDAKIMKPYIEILRDGIEPLTEALFEKWEIIADKLEIDREIVFQIFDNI